MVLLSGGEAKQASDIALGDELVGLVDGQFKPQLVLSVFDVVERCLEIRYPGGSLICSASHQIVTAGGETLSASSLCPEEHCLISSDGESLLIEFMSDAGPRKVYGWSVHPDSVFIAGGILNHNKVARAIGALL